MKFRDSWAHALLAGALVLGNWTGALSAQESAGPPPLTLQQAIDEALARNPDLIALAREYDRARLVPDTVRGFDAPMFEAAIWRWPIATINPANTDMYMFSVTQPLPARGRRDLEAGVAEADAALADAAIAVRARRIVDDVKQAWADLYLAGERRRTNADAQDLLRQFVDIATTRYSTGEAPQQDALAAMVELSRLHEEASRIAEDERLAAARLNVLLARRPESPIGRLVETGAAGPLPASADLQELALAHEPGLRSAALAVDRAEAALALTRADVKPAFTIGGGYMLMPRMGDAWMATVGVSWPRAPWSRRRIDARTAAAAADVAARRAARVAAENDVRLAVHAALVRAEAAAERVTLIESSVLPQAEQAVVVARAGYETGRGTFLALIDSQRVLLEARLDVHRARAERAQALADLERAAGVDLLSPAPGRAGGGPGGPS